MAARSGKFRFLLFLIVAGGLTLAGIGAFRLGQLPQIEISSEMSGIGRATPISVHVSEPKRGLGSISIALVQGDARYELAKEEHTPVPGWKLWEKPADNVERAFELVVGKSVQEGLKEGPATLVVEVSRAGAWLRWPDPLSKTLELPVRLKPPRIAVDSTAHYVQQGGSECVVYRVGETSIRDGVEAGERFFPGYSLPGGEPDERFALFSAPYDLDDGDAIRLIAEDDVGNTARRAFLDRFQRRPMVSDTIRVNDRFMERVVPAILEQTPELSDKGDLLQNYVSINNELRTMNAATLKEYAKKSLQEFTWHQRFIQLPNSAVTSNFADRRTYIYEGRNVDQQNHLGYDLASTSRAEIPAANAGVVLMAEYFGIYGNTVLIDHGFGLMSLYGHLSSISANVGDTVALGDVIGRTGATGLAGGDHLHFTMMLHGTQVDPREWWDAHWINDRIARKLEGAWTFQR